MPILSLTQTLLMKKLLAALILLLTVSCYGQTISYDGFYIAKTGRIEEASADMYTFFRFYRDGSVISQVVTSNDAIAVSKWFGRYKKFSMKGNYTITGNNISIQIDNKESEDYKLEGLEEMLYQGTINTDKEFCAKRDKKLDNYCFAFTKISDTTIFKYSNEKARVVIPGEWKRTQVLKGSRQVFYKNEDSTTIAFAFHDAATFPTYKAEQNEFETAYAYYEWDSKYMAEEEKMEVKKLKEDKQKAYIIWTAKDSHNDNYHLFARKGAILFNVMVYDPNMTAEKKVALLETLYELNK